MAGEIGIHPYSSHDFSVWKNIHEKIRMYSCAENIPKQTSVISVRRIKITLPSHPRLSVKIGTAHLLIQCIEFNHNLVFSLTVRDATSFYHCMTSSSTPTLLLFDDLLNLQ